MNNIKKTVALRNYPYVEKIEASVINETRNNDIDKNNIVAKEIGVIAELITLPIEVIADTNNSIQSHVDIEIESQFDNHLSWFFFRICISLLFVFIIIIIYLFSKTNI